MNVAKVFSLYRQILNAGELYSVENGEFIEASFSDLGDDATKAVIYLSVKGSEGTDLFSKITGQGLDGAELLGNDLVLLDYAGERQTLRLFALSRIEIKNDWA